MENKYLSLNSVIKMLTFQHNFVYETELMNLLLENLENYL